MVCSKWRMKATAAVVCLALMAGSCLCPMSAFAGETHLSASPQGISGLGQGGSAVQGASQDGSALSAQSASMTKFGIDVSSWQKVINWKKVSKQVSFAVIRCGFGSDYESQDDVRWPDNVRGCQKYGIPFGVYLYSYATNTAMARSEARHVIRLLQGAGLKQSVVSFPIYLDMEDESTKWLTQSEYSSIFNAFRSTLKKAGYSKVGVYSSASWWEGRLSSLKLAAKYRWVAHWNSELAAGYPKTRAKGCGVWQYGSATVAGINGEVDANWARDNLKFFSAMNSRKVFRLFNPSTGEHLFTRNVSERNWLRRNCGWNYEGVAWKSVSKSVGVPVYRLYNPVLDDHHYTASKAERNRLVKRHGWKSEGVAFYATSKKKGAPVYRLYNSSWAHGQHFFTQDKHERNVLIKRHGWKSEGVAFYAVQ